MGCKQYRFRVLDTACGKCNHQAPKIRVQFQTQKRRNDVCTKMDMKLTWIPVEGRPLYLEARLEYVHSTDHVATTLTGLRDTDLDPVQDWCVANKCGVRLSFDQFKFRNEKEIVAFLLKWG